MAHEVRARLNHGECAPARKPFVFSVKQSLEVRRKKCGSGGSLPNGKEEVIRMAHKSLGPTAERHPEMTGEGQGQGVR